MEAVLTGAAPMLVQHCRYRSAGMQHGTADCSVQIRHQASMESKAGKKPSNDRHKKHIGEFGNSIGTRKEHQGRHTHTQKDKTDRDEENKTRNKKRRKENKERKLNKQNKRGQEDKKKKTKRTKANRKEKNEDRKGGWVWPLE